MVSLLEALASDDQMVAVPAEFLMIQSVFRWVSVPPVTANALVVIVGEMLTPVAPAVGTVSTGAVTKVLDDLAEGFAVRVRSTPTYFVDGVPLSWFADPLMEDYLRKTYLKGAASPAAAK